MDTVALTKIILECTLELQNTSIGSEEGQEIPVFAMTINSMILLGLRMYAWHSIDGILWIAK